jgi:hypothetical protein
VRTHEKNHATYAHFRSHDDGHDQQGEKSDEAKGMPREKPCCILMITQIAFSLYNQKGALSTFSKF